MTAVETLATYSVPEHHVKMYTANVRATLAKEGGMLLGTVSRGSYTGERIQLVNFIGPISVVKRDTPYQDTQVSELEHTQRWLVGEEYDAAVFVDRLDTLKMIYDPTSPYVARMREAFAREYDAVIMSKFFADAKSGKDGNTNVVFPVADTVVHGGTNLTVAKLRSLRKLMKKRHVNLRGVTPRIAVTAEQTDSLLGETAVNSIDFNSVKPLVDGEVTRFMGFEFVPFEDYQGRGIPTHTDGGTIRDCPAWVPDGMHFGLWDGLAIIISNRPDKNNIKQIHGTSTFGATRQEEGKVFQVQCKES